MWRRVAVLWSLTGLGCTDTFALPLRDGGIDGASSVDGSVAAACQETGCTFDGDFTATGGALVGCHIYGTLRVMNTVMARDFKACAQMILIEGTLSADAQGENQGAGPGSGGICGSGGGHGGIGGPLGCQGGPSYGDGAMPRTRGSGGGGLDGGRGGGTIELHATTLQLTGTLTASGEDSQVGVVSGGGAGGSILIVADSIGGNGSLHARGGAGGLGGGGGGGRIAVYGVIASVPGPAFDAHGGPSTVISAEGANGSVIRP